ncbi:hypothetical protein [Alteribacter salitolerans]|uniref:hypothetical protein n=1 Tax=Alteribacter salitolerans TaxID=2912333 RepID=UPI0030137F31
MNQQEMHHLCKDHLYRYVLVTTQDQMQYDGIVENVDDDYLYMAVPVGEIGDSQHLIQGARFYGGYGYTPYYPPYYYGPRRRFQRLILPLAALAAISLLPYY